MSWAVRQWPVSTTDSAAQNEKRAGSVRDFYVAHASGSLICFAERSESYWQQGGGGGGGGGGTSLGL